MEILNETQMRKKLMSYEHTVMRVASLNTAGYWEIFERVSHEQGDFVLFDKLDPDCGFCIRGESPYDLFKKWEMSL